MTRRCKPGQRARIINGHKDRGKIVLVVRPYFPGEIVSGASWPRTLYPWVVTSLSGPLVWMKIDESERGTDLTIVMCDTSLQPLDDDDDGLARSTKRERQKPKAKRAEVQS